MASDLTSAQAGLVSDLLTAGAGVTNGVFGMITAAQNRKFADKQAKQSRQWQIEQWNMENAYNTPSAQMQRYLAAGLNPNLIYGDVGSALGGTAPSVPQGDSVSQNPPNFGVPSLVGYQQGRLIDAQIERMEIQNFNESEKNKAEVEKIWTDVGFTKEQINYIVQQTSNLVKESKMLSLEMQNMRQKIVKQRIENALASSTFDDMVKSIQSKAKCEYEQAKAAATYWTLFLGGMAYDIDVKQSQINSNNALARANRMISSLYDSQRKTEDQKRLVEFGIPNITIGPGNSLYERQMQSVIDMNTTAASQNPTWENINDDLGIVSQIVFFLSMALGRKSPISIKGFGR